MKKKQFIIEYREIPPNKGWTENIGKAPELILDDGNAYRGWPAKLNDAGSEFEYTFFEFDAVC